MNKQEELQQKQTQLLVVGNAMDSVSLTITKTFPINYVHGVFEDFNAYLRREQQMLDLQAESLRNENQAKDNIRLADTALERLEEQGDVRLNEEGKWYWTASGELF